MHSTNITLSCLSFETETKHGVLYWYWIWLILLECLLYFWMTFEALKSNTCIVPCSVPTAIEKSSLSASVSA